jgi:aldehyde:ferredoxin oxidoreductase
MKFSEATLSHFNVDEEQFKKISEFYSKIKQMEYYERKLKTGKTTFYKKKECTYCKVMVSDMTRHTQSAKHRRIADPNSFIEE